MFSDRIDRYLRGEMTKEEMTAFEAELGNNPELKADFDLTSDISTALAARAVKLEKIKGWKAFRLRRTMTFVSIAAAACIALGGFLVYPYTYSGLQDRTMQVSRAGGIDVTALWEKGDYDEALRVINSGTESAQSAVSELEALPSLTGEQTYQLELQRYTIYQLKWTRIQTLLRMREWDEAYRLAMEFSGESGDCQEKAVKLCRRLKLRVR
ncbi:MAG: hypothetical protein ACI3ZP_08135 [Candidatus Cryptobacteroides sp.]